MCDTGTRYLSKVYNDQWLLDQGLVARPRLGDLRDLISRRFDEGTVVSVGPEDTLATAFQRMRGAEVSQLPVLRDGKLLGIVDESDLLMRVHDDPKVFNTTVAGAMTRQVETVKPDAGLAAVQALLERGLVVLVADGERFYGMITRFDLLNHLRRSLA